ncbi:MAG TPA: DOPA 4,5-dioxygenase family protein [Novosphingobium sp.]|nr:DOPA 4,5-dioxygenase family protein [Novosphingobium sp.]
MPTIRDFHAHIYFDPDQAGVAGALGQAIIAAFPETRMGRVHLQPVGPHPRGSCQITVPVASFAPVTMWLLGHRGALTIFMHANTGDDLADHTAHVLWLGPSEALDLSRF